MINEKAAMRSTIKLPSNITLTFRGGAPQYHVRFHYQKIVNQKWILIQYTYAVLVVELIGGLKSKPLRRLPRAKLGTTTMLS